MSEEATTIPPGSARTPRRRMLRAIAYQGGAIRALRDQVVGSIKGLHGAIQEGDADIGQKLDDISQKLDKLLGLKDRIEKIEAHVGLHVDETQRI